MFFFCVVIVLVVVDDDVCLRKLFLGNSSHFFLVSENKIRLLSITHRCLGIFFIYFDFLLL